LTAKLCEQSFDHTGQKSPKTPNREIVTRFKEMAIGSMLTTLGYSRTMFCFMKTNLVALRNSLSTQK